VSWHGYIFLQKKQKVKKNSYINRFLSHCGESKYFWNLRLLIEQNLYYMIVDLSEKIWQSGDRTPTTCQPVQPSVSPHHRHTNTKFRVVHGKGFFHLKTNGNLRFVKHKQLRSSGKSTLNKKKFFRVGSPFLYICIFNIIYLFCPLLRPSFIMSMLVTIFIIIIIIIVMKSGAQSIY